MGTLPSTLRLTQVQTGWCWYVPPNLKIGEDNLLTLLATACTGVPGPDVPSRIWYLSW